MKHQLCFGALFLGLSIATVAQAPQNPPTTTFTARTEVVLVPVAVREKSGPVATGLKKESFRLSVDGKQVPIASFEEVTSGTAPAVAPKPSDVYTNRIANDDRPQRLTILLLDYLNTPFLNQEEERREVAKFVDKQVKPDQPVALMALTRRGLSMLQTFTTNTGDLSLAVQRSRGQMSLYEANGLHWVGTLAEDYSGSFMLKDRILLTLDELEQLGNALSGLPGRKVVVWLSGGFPFLPYEKHTMLHQDTEYLDNYRNVWHSLNQANVALYPIDGKGLVNTLWENRFSAEHRGSINLRAPIRPRYDIFQQEQDTLRNFAEETGGVACINKNQFETCIESAQQEAVDYYLLSFNLTPEMRSKDWHNIRVKVDGKYEVRARQGFGIEKSTAPDPKREMQVMGKALRSPLEYTGLKMSLRWLDTTPIAPSDVPKPLSDKDPVTKHPPTVLAKFRIELAPRAVEIDTANRNQVALTVMAVCLGNAGDAVCEMAKGIEAHLSEKELQQSDTIGTALVNEIALPSGHMRVRLALRDRMTGQIGTVEAPITVPSQ